MNSSAKKVSVAFVFFLNMAGLFALSKERQLFEILRYDVTGFSIFEKTEIMENAEIMEGKELRKFADSILIRPFFYNDGHLKKGILADLYFKDASSILYSTFDSDGLFPVVTEGDDLESRAKIDWVDQVLLALKYEALPNVPEDEDENELDENELLENSEGGGEEGEIGDSQGKDEAITEERSFFYGDGQLRKFSYGDEIFSKKETGENGELVVLSVVGNEMKRKLYDEKFRLKAVEKWLLSSSSRDTKLKSKKEYSYSEEIETATKSIEIFYKEKSVALLNEIKEENKEKEVEILYDEKGRISKKSVSHFEVEPPAAGTSSSNVSSSATGTGTSSAAENVTASVKKLLDETEAWKYDDENRIVEERKTIYKYSTSLRGKSITEKSETRTVYIYTEKSDLPDSLFYENGQLRIETVYTNSNTYSQKMYFDGKMMIVLKYEAGVKKSETTYGNGRILRERFF